KPVRLINEDIDIICTNPCLIRYNDNLVFIDDHDGTKLRPFLTKKSVSIPSRHSDEYFSGFVRSIINTNIVEAMGFDIATITPVAKPLLVIESGIKNIPVLILKFIYEDSEILPVYPEQLFTRMKKSGNSYLFEKYYRNSSWEKGCHEFLVSLGFYTDDSINYTIATNSRELNDELYNLIEYVNNLYDELTGFGFILRKGSINRNYIIDKVILTINYEIDNDWFDLKAYVRIGDISLPFISFRKHIIEDKREYLLSDGSIFILPEEWFSKYKSLFELGKQEDDILKIHKQHFALLNEAFSETECKTCPALEKLVVPDIFPDEGTPAGINAILRPYQVTGLNWMIFLQKNGLGGCLADDMGLGKTLQTLALLQYNIEKGELINTEPVPEQLSPFRQNVRSRTSLLIVPASLVYNWENEISRFTPGMKVYSYKGNQRRKDTTYFPEFDLILSSYHTVRQDIEILSMFDFFYIILDESQVIKNPASQLYKTVSRLRSNHRLVLTGTPVENSLTDLWTQLNFINNGLLGSLAYFKREYAKPIEKEQSEEKEIRLQKLISPFILRRSKDEVAGDLPPVTEQTVYCDMTDEQQKMYEEEKSAIRNTIIGNIENIGSGKTAIVVLQGLMKLRQISNHPILAEPGYNEFSGKFETVIQDIENVVAENHKILIFSSFVKHLDLFAAHFRDTGLSYAMLTGKSTNRKKIVEGFQEDPSCKVFLISLKAGGVGLNLTSADYVFILDPWWNPAAEMQALNRAHRIGQEKSVFVYKYISTGSIEEKIVRLQERKSKIAETFISSNNPLKDININEILELLA
ncbi:MAG: ATP-dependent helicase, partial [Bacteroidia bacterium]